MKVNPVLGIVSLGIAGLVTFGFYRMNINDPFRTMLTVCGGIMVFAPLFILMAVNGKNGVGANIKIVSGIFLAIHLISNIFFSIINFKKPTAYIIINGIIFLVFITIVYLVIKALNDK